MPEFLDRSGKVIRQAEKFLRRHASDMPDIFAIAKSNKMLVDIMHIKASTRSRP